MAINRTPVDPKRQAQLIAELRRDRDIRSKSYRERAMKLFPHVCARCAREFSGKRLQELTVHHKDHDHTNNPNDGSNWELLCIYCHDHEHEKYKIADYYEGPATSHDTKTVSTFNPFAGLDALIKPKEQE